MDTFLILIIALLIYTMIMPFIAWLVPKKAMEQASGYMSKVIPILGLKELIKSFFKGRGNKKP